MEQPTGGWSRLEPDTGGWSRFGASQENVVGMEQATGEWSNMRVEYIWI